MTSEPGSAAMEQFEPLEKVFIRWARGADGSLNIRKWSQFPFDGATEYGDPVVLTRERDEAREANRKLHRRSQFVEGMYQAIKFDLEMWVETLSKPHWDSSRWLFDFALRHMERSISRCDRKTAALPKNGPEAGRALADGGAQE